ncbi:MAG: ribonuclease HI family protein [Candidatus Obscuribacter phosphatis]|uniref:Ribonuclease HI family protein n=1 Tax=Candidatus Obscuribacter phosphatis TaxID=1906157 RepID=A0A8J7PE72_9BACT|nr:ribonuclease HI family protein [Candidatus Obscuribacter phosphatis]
MSENSPQSSNPMPQQVLIYADGGSRGNPGPAGCGVVLSNAATGENLENISHFLGTATNNVAEYTGLVLGLEKALALGIPEVEVRMDSELVVKQIKGEYRVKNENLKPLYLKATALKSKFKKFAISHVRREQNKEADRLANQAMDRGA